MATYKTGSFPGFDAIQNSIKSGAAEIITAYPITDPTSGNLIYSDTPGKYVNQDDPFGATALSASTPTPVLKIGDTIYPPDSNWRITPVTKQVQTGTEIGEYGDTYPVYKEVPTGTYRLGAREDADKAIFNEMQIGTGDQGKITGFNPNIYQTGPRDEGMFGGGFLGNLLSGVYGIAKETSPVWMAALGANALSGALAGAGGVAEGAGALGAASDLGGAAALGDFGVSGLTNAASLGGEYLGGLGQTGTLTGGITDVAALGGEYLGGLGMPVELTGGITNPADLGGEYLGGLGTPETVNLGSMNPADYENLGSGAGGNYGIETPEFVNLGSTEPADYENLGSGAGGDYGITTPGLVNLGSTNPADYENLGSGAGGDYGIEPPGLANLEVTNPADYENLGSGAGGDYGIGAAGTGVTPTSGLPSLTPNQLLNIIKGVGLLGGGAAVSNLINRPTISVTTPVTAPSTGIFTGVGTPYTADYFQQVQQNYNRMFPTTPANVATPLQSWYSSSFTPEPTISNKLFGV